MTRRSPRGVDEHDGEHLVVDEAAEELADAFEELVDVEDGGEFDGDLVEDFEGLGLAGDAGVEARVLDGLADARGGEGEQVQVLGTEVIEFFAFEIENADDFVFVDERNGELGADGVVGGDVVWGLWRRR